MTPSEPTSSSAESGNRHDSVNGSGKKVLPERKAEVENRKNRSPEKRRRVPKTSSIHCASDVEWGFLFAAPSPQTDEVLDEAVDIIMRHAEEKPPCDE